MVISQQIMYTETVQITNNSTYAWSGGNNTIGKHVDVKSNLTTDVAE